MKKLLLSLAAAFTTLLSFAQTNQMIWCNGRAQFAQPIVKVDSLTYPDEVPQSDTLRFILPRTIKRVVYDTVTEVTPVTVIVVQYDTVYTKPDELYVTAYNTSYFSVSDTKKVVFSRGNLQYTQSTNKWEFADEQWETIGSANVSNDTLADKIDLFGWSANNTTTPWGISTSQDATNDYQGTFVDWGKNIGDGNTWRTLTKDEWYYLFHTRSSAISRFLTGSVNGVKGIILLPDNWSYPEGIKRKESGVIFSLVTNNGFPYFYGNSGNNSFSWNTYTLADWQLMEQAGAVFLPVGYREGTSVKDDAGRYWSSSEDESRANFAYHLYISNSLLYAQLTTYRSEGMSVRLVRDL